MSSSTSTARVVSSDREATRRRARLVRRLAGLGFITPVVIFLVIFFVFPIIRSLVLSTQDWTFSSFVTGDAPFIGLGNYVTAVTDALFGKVALQTGIFTVVSIVFQFIFGLALAVFFNRHFPLSTTLRALILIPWLTPVLVSATIWRWMLNPDFGIVNSVLGVKIGWLSDPHWSLVAVIIANIWLGIPFNLILLYSGIQGIPTSLYEAAAIDGAGAWRRFISITWPLLRPVSTVTLLLGLVFTIKAFDIVYVLTGGGPVNSSDTLATWAYEIAFQNNHQLGLGAAVGEILVVAAIVFGLIYIRAQRREEFQ